MKFDVICADPPWNFNDRLKMGSTRRSASSQYNTMSLAEIKSLPISSLTKSDGTLLALWVPSSMVHHGLEVMHSWGFAHKQTYVWVKSKKKTSSDMNKSLDIGMGHLFRQTHELALIGVNNTKIYKKLQNRSQRSVSCHVNIRHSAKPELLQDSLDLMFPSSDKLELFARRIRSGWTCVGNESPATRGEDIKVSISNLISSP